MKECRRCEKLDKDLSFRRNYDVDEWLEGYPNSPIWIVGLNPVAKIKDDKRSVDQLRTEFAKSFSSGSYFRAFNRVSPWLYKKIGEPEGVAHTDLVKCATNSWLKGKIKEEIVANCRPFLEKQIAKYKPRLIICNGAEVSKFMQTAIPPEKPLGQATSYSRLVNGREDWVVLSGFIGRMDNYARRRLGMEIERIAEKLKLKKK